MQFTVINKYNQPNDILKFSIIRNAKKIIWLYNEQSTEKKLDEYLLNNSKTSLKQVCIKLLNNLKIYENGADEILLLFTDKKYDKLAQLITYGNSEVQGSSILKDALKYN